MYVLFIIIILIIILGGIFLVWRKKDTFLGNIHRNIDAVITFRGEDFSLNDKREAYNYEIKYCLRSITMYMPWIRKIFILQNSSGVPSFFSNDFRNKNVVLLSHKQVIPSKYLPTTNSDSIETFLTFIPGLSEHFIYFCDDMFVNKPLEVDYFFTSEGIPRRLNFQREYLEQTKYKFRTPPSPGSEKWYPHVPLAYTKTEINNYLRMYPEFIEYIRSIRSRKDENQNIMACTIIGLTYPCLQLHTNVAYMNVGINNLKTEDDVSDYFIYPWDTEKIPGAGKLFFCMGDHFEGSVEERSLERNKLKKVLDLIYPYKSRAE